MPASDFITAGKATDKILIPLISIAILLFSANTNADVPIPATQLLPHDPGTGPTDRDVPFLAWFEDLAPDGYVEEEILMSGTAKVYEYADDEAQSPIPQPTGASGPYTTRVLIRRPANPADFNGVVYLEILNATARYDGAPMWDLTHNSIIADGAAYVGVTYSDQTAHFMTNIWGTANFPAPANAQPRDNSRYSTLNVPTRAYTWDILNQAAALLKADEDTRNPMQGFGVNTIITTGYSQSARYVTTFANSFFPSYSELSPCTEQLDALDACEPVVDGYIISAGGANSSKLDGGKAHAIGDRRNCENALNREAVCREDGIEPVADNPYAHKLPKIMRFTTESDISSARVRQTMEDQPLARAYEVAGTSHVDYWGSLQGQYVSEYQFGTVPTGEVNSPCDLPFNPLRTGIPLSAIQHRLARWIQYDETPPASRYMVWEGDFNKRDQFFNQLVWWVRDDGDNDATDGDYGVGDGNAIGGVRPPRINAPLGRYYGSNFLEGPFSVTKIFCTGIFGGFDAYTQEELQELYYNHRIFVLKTWWNVWLSWRQGFLLPVDAKVIMDEAKSFEGIPEPGRRSFWQRRFRPRVN